MERVFQFRKKVYSCCNRGRGQANERKQAWVWNFRVVVKVVGVASL